jgi:hypothetical protein
MIHSILRKFLLPGYEIVPVNLLATLADAAQRPYLPAFGGDEYAVERSLNAANAALHIIRRYRARTRFSVSIDPLPKKIRMQPGYRPRQPRRRNSA